MKDPRRRVEPAWFSGRRGCRFGRARERGRRAVGYLLACLIVALAAACSSRTTPRLLDETNTIDLSPKYPAKVDARAVGSPAPKDPRHTQQFYPGQDAPPRRLAGAPRGVTKKGGNYLLNIEDVSLAEAAKLVLGDALGENYLVDSRVQGTMTLSASRPLTAKELLDAFEASLRMNAAVLVKDEGHYKIIPYSDVAEGEMGSADFAADGGATPGYGVSVVPLRYISSASMMELMDNFVARNGSIRASAVGNLILFRGTAPERDALVDIALSFDVDWMKSQSAGIVTLAHSAPGEIVAKLEAIFAGDAAGPSASQNVRLIALERLNAVLVVANRQDRVKRALAWIGRLDRPNPAGVNYYVYTVQNGKARDIAEILNSTFGEDAEGEGAAQPSDVTPGQAPVQQGTATASPGTDENGTSEASSESKTGNLNIGTAQPTSSENDVVSFQPAPGLRITASVANNTLVIRATQQDYQRILSILNKIDTPVVQVLINTTIAEVSLNDNLRYGVQAYFRSNDVGAGVFGGGNSLVLKPGFPGLNFLIGSSMDPQLVLDALASVTKVRVVSSPSVVVVDNQPATIKVGDQVPITTQQVVGTQDATAPIVNAIEYRDSGVILQVTPRVNAAGLVTMAVAQELSAVAPSASGATNLTPTISQRTITSTISVYSGQTVVLGGLISGQENRSRDSVPGVNRIPLIGDLLGRTEHTSKRNELVVFITPQVIRDREDAAQVSEELRSKLKLLNRP